MRDLTTQRATSVCTGGTSFLVENGLLYLDLDKVKSIELFYEDGDSLYMVYERIDDNEYLYRERFIDNKNPVCDKCGEPIDDPKNHQTCFYTIGDEYYINDVIDNIIEYNKDELNTVKILFTINSDISSIFKVV